MRSLRKTIKRPERFNDSEEYPPKRKRQAVIADTDATEQLERQAITTHPDTTEQPERQMFKPRLEPVNRKRHLLSPSPMPDLPPASAYSRKMNEPEAVRQTHTREELRAYKRRKIMQTDTCDNGFIPEWDLFQDNDAGMLRCLGLKASRSQERGDTFWTFYQAQKREQKPDYPPLSLRLRLLQENWEDIALGIFDLDSTPELAAMYGPPRRDSAQDTSTPPNIPHHPKTVDVLIPATSAIEEYANDAKRLHGSVPRVDGGTGNPVFLKAENLLPNTTNTAADPQPSYGGGIQQMIDGTRGVRRPQLDNIYMYEANYLQRAARSSPLSISSSDDETPREPLDDDSRMAGRNPPVDSSNAIAQPDQAESMFLEAAQRMKKVKKIDDTKRRALAEQAGN
ncbi:hypothetical protein M8818_006542 [Zalaria obscura]|uniref:Uncharacterized protein n=1 Tax=Zalaria obscura TaxID=2024903 RepID=A0ACC3S6K0_9PEZI